MLPSVIRSVRRIPPTTLRSQTGVTYLMLLALVFLLGLGLAAVATYWQTIAQREKERELLFIGQQFRTALLSYAGSSKQYPESLEQLVLDDRAPNIRRHLRRIYIDPLTGKSDWGLIRRDGRIIGVYSLAVGSPLIRDGFPKELVNFSDAASYEDWRFQAEATAKTAADGKGKDGQPPAFDPAQHQVESSPLPSGPVPDRRRTVEDETTKCEKVAERAVEQCWSDLNSDDANNRCQDQAQRLYWECQTARQQ